ncbi:MAG: hypothetical protein ACLRVS_06690 [Lachnospiraceae bacterium]
MARRFKYSIPQMTRRLLHIAAPVKGTLAVSTLASIVGNLAQMGLMGFGALMLMSRQRHRRAVRSERGLYAYRHAHPLSTIRRLRPLPMTGKGYIKHRRVRY